MTHEDNGAMEYSLTLREEGITLDGVPHVLREANEDAVRKYNNAIFSGTTLRTVSGTPRPEKISGGGDLDSLLLGECLFRCNDDGAPLDKPVPISVIRSMPRRVTKALVAKVREMSDMVDVDMDDAAKNVQEATESGSP